MDFELDEDVAGFFLVYFTCLMIYITVFSGLDFKTNEYYKMRWNSLSLRKKLCLIFLNITHNIVFFFSYFTPLFIIYAFKTGLLYKNINVFNIFCGINLLSLLMTYIGWDDNGTCFLTVWHNNIIGIHKEVAFRDFYSIINNEYFTIRNPLRNKIYYNILYIYAILVGRILYVVNNSAEPNNTYLINKYVGGGKQMIGGAISSINPFS